MSDNYSEEIQPLFKLLANEAFRFVIVRHRHFSLVKRLEADLQIRFSDRPVKIVNAADKNFSYRQLIDAYCALQRGFYFIENFEELLKQDRDSQVPISANMAANNQRRRDITVGMNLHRDYLARFPIALFIFIAGSAGEMYAKTIMEKMPDLWSFRSLIMDLALPEEATLALPDRFIEANLLSFDPATIIAPPETLSELKRLQQALADTPPNEKAYLLTLYPQLFRLQFESGNYQDALTTLETWHSQAGNNDKTQILIGKGDVYETFGDLNQALDNFIAALALCEQTNDTTNKAICLERIGSIYTAQGNLEQALAYFEEETALFKSLYVVYPSNVSFKHGLAISYEKLGATHTAQGNLAQALEFFEEFYRLSQELYAAYPSNVRFKNGLAVSYERLGATHTALGNLAQALEFFEEAMKLSQELYAAYPSNVSFKRGLAISYEKLGATHTALGNLAQALGYFEE
ncbi:MAG: hypothetical protein CTY34_09520, partial [Methylobacter sp.]